MGRIIAIGGGDFLNRTIKRFDDFIMSKVGKNPTICFIGAASSDNSSLAFKKIYESEYECQVILLNLVKEKYSYEKIKSIILGSDLIYVGGGNTKLMLDIFSQYKVDELLYEAYKKNILLCGISAGAICWFKGAYTDKDCYQYNGVYYNFKMIPGLGFLDFNCCPHYDVLGKDAFNEYGGIALENNSMIYIEDSSYETLSVKGGACYFISDRIVELKKGNIGALINV